MTTASPTRTLRFTLTLLLPLAALPGCMVVQTGSLSSALVSGGSSGRAAADASGDGPGAIDDAWPERWGRRGQRIKGVVVPVEGPLDDWVGVRLGEHHQLRAAEEERVAMARLASGEPDAGMYRYRAEGPGSFVFVRRFQDPDDPRSEETLQRRQNNPDEPAAMFRFVSGQRAGEQGGVPHIEIQRTWFALYDPAPGVEARGTLVLLPGMFGTPDAIIHTTVRRFRGAGWTVIRMLSHPGRFTQRATFEVDPSNLDAAGAGIARVFDQRTAEVAYSVEAAVEYAHTLRPELADRRHVLLGMSGGAMALPTVHARNPELYDAAILIAGGANFLRISMDSNYASWIDSVELDWTQGRASRAEVEGLIESYLGSASLDAEHTAPLLESKPVLMLHAARDKAVPARTGERLWRLSGEPERWIFPVGHELIFVALPMQLERMLRWLDEHDPEGEDPGS